AEVYGIWLVMASFLGYLQLSDVGVGASTGALIGRAKSYIEVRAIINKSLLTLTTIALGLLAVGTVLVLVVPNWISLLNIQQVSLRRDAQVAMMMSFLLFCISLPLSVFPAALGGLQEITLQRAYLILRTLVGLTGLWLIVVLRGNLVHLVLVNGLGDVLVSVLSLVTLIFLHQRIWANPLQSTRIQPAQLINSNLYFLSARSIAQVVSGTDNIVINSFVGATSVTVYSTQFRLLQIGFALLGTVLNTLGPAYGRAFAQENWTWLKHVYQTALRLGPAVAGGVWLGAVIFSQDLIAVLLGPEIQSPIILALVLGAWVYVTSYTTTPSGLLHASYVSWLSILAGIAEAFVNLSMSLWLVHSLGTLGVALGTLIGALTTTFWMLPLIIKRQTNNRLSFDYRFSLKHFSLCLLPALAAGMICARLPDVFYRVVFGLVVLLVYTIATGIYCWQDLMPYMRRLVTIVRSLEWKIL
ncbi:MAG: polysaccharide biosynthesis C-terminal domain-containing protein, partial [Thaumarchaeota archaeon]|nr:polysaccharide biosynthesis C-terminal domain-containing protein [Nitrososphaerota archaeon]